MCGVCEVCLLNPALLAALWRLETLKSEFITSLVMNGMRSVCDGCCHHGLFKAKKKFLRLANKSPVTL